MYGIRVVFRLHRMETLGQMHNILLHITATC